MINIYVYFLVLHNSVYDNILYHLLMTKKIKYISRIHFFSQTTQSGNIIVKPIKFNTHLFQWIAFIATVHVFECEAS